MSNRIPTLGSLFSGIGGIDLGFERAGFKIAWHVERDRFCRTLLNRYWPRARRWDDVRTFPPAPAVRWRVDVIAGGFPCQPVSSSGKRLAQADPRWLWPHFARIIDTLRPRFVVIENVVGLLSCGIRDVLGQLAALRYDAEWDVLPAAVFGAPHLRQRVIILAYPCRLRRERRSVSKNAPDQSLSARPVRLAHAPRLLDRSAPSLVADRILSGPIRRSRWWETEPALDRVVDGVPLGVDRLRSLGNAVVPQLAEWVGGRLIEAMKSTD